MKKSKKKKLKIKRVLSLILILGVLIGLFFWVNRKKLQVITIEKEIPEYNYTLESNATSLYKKYYEELEKELKETEIDEEKYASLVARLFVIDYYTLNNKVTNKNIGGVEFIHSKLKDSFIMAASNTIYKYVENNIYGTRKQKLPEVKNVKIKEIESTFYEEKEYEDELAYKIVVTIEYIKDYDYPEEVTLVLIHEEKKLGIVEIK